MNYHLMKNILLIYFILKKMNHYLVLFLDLLIITYILLLLDYNYLYYWFFLCDEKKLIYILKKLKDYLIELKYEIIKNMHKWLLFFIIIILLIIITWYLVTCFDNIYQNLKFEWIRTYIIINFLMQILSLLFSLLKILLDLLVLSGKMKIFSRMIS